MFNDIRDEIVKNVARLKELRDKHYQNGHREIEVRFSEYRRKDVSQTDFLRLRAEFDEIVAKSQRSPDLRDTWKIIEVRDNVFIHAPPENTVDPPDTISHFRIITTDIPNPGGKAISKQTNMRKISILNDIKGTTDKNKKAPALRSTLYPFRIGFSIEVEGARTNVQVQSEYRDRDRKSYVLNRGGKDILQVDTTIVKENSNSQTKKILYEVEIELLVEYDDQSEIALAEITEKILKNINQTRFLYTLEERTKVISFLNSNLNRLRNEHSILTRFVNKPIDLTWEDLKAGNTEGLFPQLVSTNNPTDYLYTVTVKLDGLRMFVFFDESGVYLFNPLAHIICKINDKEIPALRGTVLDGELLIGKKEELHNAKEYNMYLFDCLRILKDGEIYDLRSNTHLVRRKGIIHSIKLCAAASDVWSDIKLLMFSKKFYAITDRESFYEANIQALTKVVVRNPTDQELELSLGSDGLIYTHAGEYLPEEGSKNRRWKPPNQLTIDFRILMINDRNNPNSKIGVPAVYVQKRVQDEKQPKQIPFYGTNENRFDPTAVELENVIDGFPVRISEEQIAEFRYDTRKKVFVPLRQRFDKDQPNDIKTAIATWKLIQNPIQRGIMTGTIKGTKILDLMRKFHNNFKRVLLDIVHQEVKQPSYKAMPTNVSNIERPILMDIGSGAGGDVDKWKFAGKKGEGFNIVAIEPQADRVRKLAERVKNAKMQDRVNILEVDARKTKSILSKLGNLYGNRKVDAVSMFHVLTFFYDSENSISQLLATIKGSLRYGGIFVAMALDGDLVYRQMGDSAQIKLPGIMITKVDGVHSRKIRVQLSTPTDESLASGQIEYLVDFDHFITQFEANGFELIDDRYLDAEAVLNDSEMWWSQMTKVVMFRYVGGNENLKRDSLDKLKDILMRANNQVYPLLVPNEMQQIKVERSVFQNFDLWTVGVLGDGSCFLHSILYAINAKYRTMNNEDRKKIVMGVRRDLALLFTEEVYQSIADGNTAQLGRDNNSFSYDVLKNGLLDYGHWFGIEFLQFVSNVFVINIQLVWWRDNKMQVYKSAGEQKLLFQKGRNTIILFWQGQNHFQPIGRKINNDIGFVFYDHDSLAKLFQEE